MYRDPLETRVTWLFGAGIVLVIVGLLGGAFLFAAGVFREMFTRGADQAAFIFLGVPLLAFVVGLILMLIGLLMGGKEAFFHSRSAREETVGPVYIIALVARGRDDEVVFDFPSHDPDELKLYVQVLFQNGRKREFETAYPVFMGIGEGMWGNVTYQGRWLSRFERVLVEIQR